MIFIYLALQWFIFFLNGFTTTTTTTIIILRNNVITCIVLMESVFCDFEQQQH